jgi:hypothetical protein
MGGRAVTLQLTSTTATFTPPPDQNADWRLNLWSGGHIEGTATGTGTLVVPVPAVPGCQFQADVEVKAPGEHWHWHAGTRAIFPTCGPPPTTTTTVPVTTTTVPPTTTTTLPPLPPGQCEHPHIATKGGPVPYPCPKPVLIPPAHGQASPPPVLPTATVVHATVVPASSLAFTGAGAGLQGLFVAGTLLLGCGAMLARRARKMT